MPILIDGHNLIGRMANISLADPDDEEKLIRALVSYRARSGKRITVVFDPGAASTLAETQQRGGVEVVFAAPGRRADDVIVRRVRRSQHRRGLTVITSDLEVAEAVERLGARVRSADDFAAELSGPDSLDGDRGDIIPSPEDIEYWQAVFGAGEDDDSPGESNEFLAIFGDEE